MNDFVLQARGFWRISSSLSLVTTKYLSCYIRFPHIMHSKHISNKKQTYWKNKVHWVKQTIKLYEFFLWKTIVLVTHCFIVYTPDYKYRALHFFSFSCLLEYRLFIASKHMSSQRTIFLLGKDKLVNLKLTVFFIFPSNRAIFQKIEGKSFKTNWFWRYFCPQLSRAKEDVTQNCVIVHEIITDCFSEGNDMRWVATCKVFRQFDSFMGTNWY